MKPDFQNLSDYIFENNIVAIKTTINSSKGSEKTRNINDALALACRYNGATYRNVKKSVRKLDLKDMINMLISTFTPDLNSLENSYKKTPLMMAICFCQNECDVWTVKTLLENDADVNKKNEDYETALELLLQKNLTNKDEIIQILLNYGAKPCITIESARYCSGINLLKAMIG